MNPAAPDAAVGEGAKASPATSGVGNSRDNFLRFGSEPPWNKIITQNPPPVQVQGSETQGLKCLALHVQNADLKEGADLAAYLFFNKTVFLLQQKSTMRVNIWIWRPQG